ncbi:hypothetical protein GGI04_003004 [Coemansia thaxteri]|nr:hypothetical protein GGI04_003004 [Coemansia thaxteri]
MKPVSSSSSSGGIGSSSGEVTLSKSSDDAFMTPSSCAVLIVDKRFLCGVYYTNSSSSSSSNGTAGAMRGGPARDDVVFVQELLEVAGIALAVLKIFIGVVLSGDSALQQLFNSAGNKSIIVLIDIDDTYDPGDAAGLIYTPPPSPGDHRQAQHASGGEQTGPYGLALLRVIAHYVAIGVFRNVAPIGK